MGEITTPSDTAYDQAHHLSYADIAVVSVPDPRTGGGGSGEVAYINSLWDTASIQAS